METKFTRDDEGRWFTPGDKDNAWVPWETDLWLTLNAPDLLATVKTEGWVSHELENLQQYRSNATTVDAFTYRITGPVELDSNQRLGLITLEGVQEYTGEVIVQIHDGDPAKSQINHYEASNDYPRPTK